MRSPAPSAIAELRIVHRNGALCSSPLAEAGGADAVASAFRAAMDKVRVATIRATELATATCNSWTGA